MTIYTWDEAKRKSNVRVHGLDFSDAHVVIEQSILTIEDTRFHYTERRFTTFGYLHDKAVSITYTEHKNVIRIISFRTASRRKHKRLLGAI
jgi:uncharacterized DUF497 family protein